MKNEKENVIEKALQFKLGTGLCPSECAKKVERPKFWSVTTFITITILQIASFVEFFQTNTISDLWTMILLTLLSIIISGLVYYMVGKVEIGYNVKAIGLEYLRIAEWFKCHKLQKVLKETSPECVTDMIEYRLFEYSGKVMKAEAEGIDSKIKEVKAKFNDLFNLAKELGVNVKPYSEFFPKRVILRKHPF